MRVFRRAKPLIVKLFAGQNAKLAHLWRKVVEEHDLVPALAQQLGA